MCTSVGPAEFNGTVIANYPADRDNETLRMLSYMNSAQSRASNSRFNAPITQTGPNAMLYPVYGEVREVFDSPDPKASRSYLDNQRGVYRENGWRIAKTRGGNRGLIGAMGSIVTAGNYLVTVASGVESIPSALHNLKAASPKPENVPDAPDHILGHMDAFYREQDLGIPQFVIAAFVLSPGQVEEKNPVTLSYTQSETVADKIVLPALDYHGQGEFEEFVTREHRLLFATLKLNQIFRSAMTSSSQTIPPFEFSSAPIQFPIELNDSRKGGSLSAAAAPNNDYIFDAKDLEHALGLESVSLDLTDKTLVPSNDYKSRYLRSTRIGNIVAEAIGSEGLMGYSNQAAITPGAYAGDSSWGNTLDMSNY